MQELRPGIEHYRQREVLKSEYKPGDYVLIYLPSSLIVKSIFIEEVLAVVSNGSVVDFKLFFKGKDQTGRQYLFIGEDQIKRKIKKWAHKKILRKQRAKFSG